MSYCQGCADLQAALSQERDVMGRLLRWTTFALSPGRPITDEEDVLLAGAISDARHLLTPRATTEGT